MSQKTEFIWWHQVGRSLRLLEEVSRHLAAGESFLLSAPGGIPWEASFRQRLRETASETDSQRRLRFVTDTGQDPGKYCMEELCPKEWAQKRWPSVPRPSYLCQNPSLPFHKLFLWVSALEGEKRLEAWTGFIKEYEREAEKAGLPSRAVFILESQKGQEKPSSLPRVDYSITINDCRVFCMEELSGYEQDTCDYLIEIAVQVAGENPQICHDLLTNPEELLAHPGPVAKRVLERFLSEPGQNLEKSVNRSIWKAQVRQFFPLLEECRMAFLQKGEEALRRALPITNDYGKQVTAVIELEFRDIQTILYKGHSVIPGLSEKDVNLCRQSRNRLAHNDLLGKDEVVRLFALRRDLEKME